MLCSAFKRITVKKRYAFSYTRAITNVEEGEPMNEISGTKELIFDTFLDMASTFGYENAGVRAIAKKVGIHPASIYHHFASKKAMLEYAYEYYSKHLYNSRRPVAAMKNLLETAGAEEIVAAFACSFAMEDQKKHSRLALITKIIYMRMFQDPIANEIFIENYKNSVKFVISVLKHGLGVGRIERDFDLEAFADIMIGSVEIMKINAFAGTAYTTDQSEREKRVMAMLERLLSVGLK
jgi:AcrR family transcriptional regulator